MTDYSEFHMGLLQEQSWLRALKEEFALPYVKSLERFLEEEGRSGNRIYPPLQEVFSALEETPFDEVRVVIIGQDPYHGEGEAHGLSFSVKKGVALPPSLRNIFKELVEDVKVPYPKHGCLLKWAKQGVLLLNATLTVRKDQPRSHYGRGWERFTDRIIELLCKKEDPIVFVLWGKSAQEKYARVLLQRKHPHAVLMSSHPSPFSATGFFGTKPFSKINDFLNKWGKKPIDWSID